MNSSLTKYTFKTKIDLTDFCNGEEHSVTLREPTTAEMKYVFRLQNAAQKLEKEDNVEDFADALADFGKILPQLIVDHNFTEEGVPDKKLPSKDVAEFIASKLDCISNVTMELMKQLPLVKSSKGK